MPGARAALETLAGQIDAPAMIAMNARARLERVPEREVAAAFLRARLGEASVPTAAPRLPDSSAGSPPGSAST